GASRQAVVSVSTVDPRENRVGEDAVALVDTDNVVSGPGIDRDPGDVLACEAEIGRAVVTDVDLENAGVTSLQAKRDLVVGLSALDQQLAALELGPLELASVVPAHRRLPHGGTAGRDRIPLAAVDVESCAGGLARPLVPREVVKRVAVVGDLHPAVGSTSGSQ